MRDGGVLVQDIGDFNVSCMIIIITESAIMLVPGRPRPEDEKASLYMA
jgi:hypothetical protein